MALSKLSHFDLSSFCIEKERGSIMSLSFQSCKILQNLRSQVSPALLYAMVKSGPATMVCKLENFLAKKLYHVTICPSKKINVQAISHNYIWYSLQIQAMI